MRVKTGIPGLDELVDGGFLKGSTVMVTGRSGSGKSVMAMQYVGEGVNSGEPAVFVSFGQEKDEVYQSAHELGWHFKQMVNQRNLHVLGGPVSDISRTMKKNKAKTWDIISEIVNAVAASGATRLAIDGLDTFSMFYPNDFSFRVELEELKRAVRKNGCTTLWTSFAGNGDGAMLAKYDVQEKLADGIIVLHHTTEGLRNYRWLEVRKMIETSHTSDLYPIRIARGGIKIEEVAQMAERRLEGRNPVPKVSNQTCVFCDSAIDKPLKIASGGRASFCESCLGKLEEGGVLAKADDGAIELRATLFDIIADYATATA